MLVAPLDGHECSPPPGPTENVTSYWYCPVCGQGYSWVRQHTNRGPVRGWAINRRWASRTITEAYQVERVAAHTPPRRWLARRALLRYATELRRTAEMGAR